ncbi:MAG: hypothetical protein KDH92_09725, partial [Chloroflexi bacterium]|nr:hypothetical protein [Chloroflexota bacterium]
MIAQPKPETTRRVKPAPLPPVPFVRPERLVATVEKGGAELPLAGVTAVDLATLADAQRRADARRLDFEDRVRMLQAADAKLAGILAELEAAEAEVEAVTAKLDAGL